MHSAAISVRSALRPSRMYLKPLPFLADQVLGRDLEVVEEQLVGLVVDHVRDRPHRQAVADRVAQVDDEDRHAFGLLLHVGERRRAREQDHQVGVLDARDPHLLAVDDVAVALAARRWS